MAHSCPRPFVLRRHQDVAGTSVTSDIAEGVQFTDGTSVLHWRSDDHHTSTAVYANVDELIAIYGHDGSTTVEWLDPLLDDDWFQAAVTEVLEERLAEVRQRHADVIDTAGFPAAAVFLRNYRDEQEASRG